MPLHKFLCAAQCIKGKRDKYVIATKCGITMKDGQMAFDGSRKHVREACEASLERLGIDSIDLYYLHRWVLKRPHACAPVMLLVLVGSPSCPHLLYQVLVRWACCYACAMIACAPVVVDSIRKHAQVLL